MLQEDGGEIPMLRDCQMYAKDNPYSSFHFIFHHSNIALYYPVVSLYYLVVSLHYPHTSEPSAKRSKHLAAYINIFLTRLAAENSVPKASKIPGTRAAAQEAWVKAYYGLTT